MREFLAVMCVVQVFGVLPQRSAHAAPIAHLNRAPTFDLFVQTNDGPPIDRLRAGHSYTLVLTIDNVGGPRAFPSPWGIFLSTPNIVTPASRRYPTLPGAQDLMPGPLQRNQILLSLTRIRTHALGPATITVLVFAQRLAWRTCIATVTWRGVVLPELSTLGAPK